MRELVSYPGGKGGAGVAQALINLMPPHGLYIEPFLGSGTIMRIKRPALVNVGIDRLPAALEMAMRDLASSAMELRDRLPANLNDSGPESAFMAMPPAESPELAMCAGQPRRIWCCCKVAVSAGSQPTQLACRSMRCSTAIRLMFGLFGAANAMCTRLK